jgi:REP element-mobilizing transposase RayT
MDQPKRKPLRIPQFAYSAPGAYFVTICTLNRRCVLSSISAEPGIADGPRTNLTEIGKTVEKYILSSTRIPNLHVEKYVIMPNHVHLLLIIEAGENDMRESTPAN